MYTEQEGEKSISFVCEFKFGSKRTYQQSKDKFHRERRNGKKWNGGIFLHDALKEKLRIISSLKL